MDPVVAVALVGLAGILATGVVAPIAMSRLTASVAAKVQAADWERQDAVAARLQRSTADVLAASKAAATQTITARQEIGSQLTVIHSLVNSNYTQQLENLRESTLREVVSLEEIVDLKRAAGREPSAAALAAIASAKDKIAALDRELVARAEQQKAAAASAQTSTHADADRIVQAIENLPGQGGTPQDVTIVQPKSDPVPVKQQGA